MPDTKIFSKILETDRLLLRHFQLTDVDDLAAIYRDADVRQYFPRGVLSYEQTKEELEWFLNGHPEHPELGLWTVIDKKTNQLIGRCGLLPWTLDGCFEVEVAYLLAKKYWGQGLGTEAAQAVMRYGFEKLRLPRLICLIAHQNKASIKVAEKMGMAFEREGVEEGMPFLLYVKNTSVN